jgi:hypothetical protein
MKQEAGLQDGVLDVESPKIDVTISENRTLKGEIQTIDMV